MKDYAADLNNGETTEVEGIKIVAKIAKKVKEIDLVEIGNESNQTTLYTSESGYQNPEIDLKNDLNLFKIVTIYNDETSEEDSSFYIEKYNPEIQTPEAQSEDAPPVQPNNPPIQNQQSQQDDIIIGGCVLDSNLGRKVVVPEGGNPFDCELQNQVCEEFTNSEGKQDAHCIDPPQEGQ